MDTVFAMTTRSMSTLEDLAEARLIAPESANGLRPVAERYAIGVTPFLARRLKTADPHGVLARSFLPSKEELVRLPEERGDPIGDAAHSPAPFLVHRYPDRVLLMPVPVCPVYCRFCFRREAVGPEKGLTARPADLDRAIDYIREHTEIREVILTGGDPFMLSSARVHALSSALSSIEHVRLIRWHTRMPVADPERISPGFVAALKASSKPVYVAAHINHTDEAAPETLDAFARLADAGIPILSQTVLLKGINDSVNALRALFECLVEARVRPYYLHHPDLAPGTSHFRLTIEEGQALFAQLADSVSGLALPHYVLDIPGGVSKARIAMSDVRSTERGLQLRGRDGRWHVYEPR
jgi:lysine 2,3-aminomutase